MAQWGPWNMQDFNLIENFLDEINFFDHYTQYTGWKIPFYTVQGTIKALKGRKPYIWYIIINVRKNMKNHTWQFWDVVCRGIKLYKADIWGLAKVAVIWDSLILWIPSVPRRLKLTSDKWGDDQGQNHESQESHEELTRIGDVGNGDRVQIQGFQQDPNDDTKGDSGESDDEQQVLHQPSPQVGKSHLFHFGF